MTGVFWRCPITDFKIKKQIYHSLVESHLNYGLLLYASSFSRQVANHTDESHSYYTPSNLKPVNVTLNKILRAIFRVPKYDKKTKTYTDNSILYKKLGVLKLIDLYRYNLAILVYNAIYSETCPRAIAELFKLRSDVIQRNTRAHEMDLYFETPHCTKALCKPSIAGALLWNSLPSELKICTSLLKFKTALKVSLTRNY